jgi:hypothetical protein
MALLLVLLLQRTIDLLQVDSSKMGKYSSGQLPACLVLVNRDGIFGGVANRAISPQNKPKE